MTPSVVRKALGRFDVKVEMSPEFRTYTVAETESLLKAGRIKTMPDWARPCAATCSSRRRRAK